MHGAVGDLGELNQVMGELRQFMAEREWQTFHDPKNLAMAIASEVGELCALYRWIPNAEADAFSQAKPEPIADEVADVLILTLLLADRAGIDVPSAIRRKMEKNRANYPLETAKGNAQRHR